MKKTLKLYNFAEIEVGLYKAYFQEIHTGEVETRMYTREEIDKLITGDFFKKLEMWYLKKEED